jgi:hypothetical protein
MSGRLENLIFIKWILFIRAEDQKKFNRGPKFREGFFEVEKI